MKFQVFKVLKEKMPILHKKVPEFDAKKHFLYSKFMLEEGLKMFIYHLRLELHLIRVSTGVLNFRASLYRDQFQFFCPYWYLNFLKVHISPKFIKTVPPRIQIVSNNVT